MFKPPWLAPAERKLLPYQGAVYIILMLVILLSGWLFWKGTAVQKTAWVVYLGL